MNHDQGDVRDTERRYNGPERRRSNGNGGDWTAGLPVWLRAVLILGPTAAIAIYLVWVGANQAPEIAAQVRQNHAEIQRLSERMAEHSLKQDAQYRVLIWICVNTSKDENARKNCFEQ